jgi:hypothetical protein
MEADCTGRMTIQLTWHGALVLIWVGVVVDESGCDTWHHCKCDTWHRMTWKDHTIVCHMESG